MGASTVVTRLQLRKRNPFSVVKVGDQRLGGVVRNPFIALDKKLGCGDTCNGLSSGYD